MHAQDVVSKSWARDALQRFKKQQLKLKGGLQDVVRSATHSWFTALTWLALRLVNAFGFNGLSQHHG
eukprot:3699597-Amphidinium_carterae.1